MSDPDAGDSDDVALQRQIERALLGGERRYTRRQVAELANVEFERARSLWMALGFAEAGDDEIVFTDGDVEALQLWDGLVGNGLVPQNEELSFLRALGYQFGRLAEWQTREITKRFRTFSGEPEDLARIAKALLPLIERLQSYVWRRHLASVSGRALSVSTEELSELTLTVGFADIVGYTSATRRTDGSELSDLLDRFEANAADAVVEQSGRIVKTVGDEVLFVADSPQAGAEIALRLTDPHRAEEGLPQLRVGLALGTVLARFGDVYGPVVNLAARLTSEARPGTALVDSELAEALREDDRYQLRGRRPVSVRGYHRLHSWALRRGR
jgi:adenylate cyclase